MKAPIFTILALSLCLSACSQAVKAENTAAPSSSSKAIGAIGVKPKAEGESGPKEMGVEHIKDVVRKYNETSSVKMNLEKILHLGLIGEKRKSEGKLYFSKGKLRMVIEKPENTLLVMDGSNIWIENVLPKEMGGKTQVSRMKSPKGAAKKKAPLAFLLHKPEVWDQFKITSTKQEKSNYYYALVPKDPESIPEIVSLKVMISKNNSIARLSFSDDLENLTVFAFNKVKFDAKVSQRKFKYKPPSGAEVTEY